MLVVVLKLNITDTLTYKFFLVLFSQKKKAEQEQKMRPSS